MYKHARPRPAPPPPPPSCPIVPTHPLFSFSYMGRFFVCLPTSLPRLAYITNHECAMILRTSPFEKFSSTARRSTGALPFQAGLPADLATKDGALDGTGCPDRGDAATFSGALVRPISVGWSHPPHQPKSFRYPQHCYWVSRLFYRCDTDKKKI